MRKTSLGGVGMPVYGGLVTEGIKKGGHTLARCTPLLNISGVIRNASVFLFAFLLRRIGQRAQRLFFGRVDQTQALQHP